MCLRLELVSEIARWRLCECYFSIPGWRFRFFTVPQQLYTSFPRALGSRGSEQIDSPIRTKSGVGHWSWLSFKESIQRKMVSDRLLL